jgi:hypothetical protein
MKIKTRCREKYLYMCLIYRYKSCHRRSRTMNESQRPCGPTEPEETCEGAVMRQTPLTALNLSLWCHGVLLFLNHKRALAKSYDEGDWFLFLFKVLTNVGLIRFEKVYRWTVGHWQPYCASFYVRAVNSDIWSVYWWSNFLSPCH